MKIFYTITILIMLLLGWGIYATVQYRTAGSLQPDGRLVGNVPIVPSSQGGPRDYAPSVNPPVVSNSVPSIAPGAPYGLTVAVVTPSQANLSWQSPKNKEGLIGFVVYKNNLRIGFTIDTLYSDPDFSPAQDNAYSVASYGKGGLLSAYSNIFNVAKGTGLAVSTPASTPTPAPSSGSSPTPAPTPTPTPTPTPPPTPQPNPTPTPSPAPSCGSGGACTAAQVAQHNTRSNCWVYLSPVNKVYNITSYVANGRTHPGGDVIAPYCGANIYSYFLGTAGGHKHSSSALNNVLQTYYIGPFQP